MTYVLSPDMVGYLGVEGEMLLYAEWFGYVSMAGALCT